MRSSLLGTFAFMPLFHSRDPAASTASKSRCFIQIAGKQTLRLGLRNGDALQRNGIVQRVAELEKTRDFADYWPAAWTTARDRRGRWHRRAVRDARSQSPHPCECG